MASFTDFTENELLDHILGTGAYTMPTQVYLALFTAAPSDTGGGTEVSGNAYTRMAIDFTAASGGATSNSADVTFPTATGAWGTITHIGLFDASTAGNMLAWAPLAANKTVASGDAIQFLAGEVDVSLT